MELRTRVKLNNSVDIPVLGFGTYQIIPFTADKAVLHALEAGYRHIDTAAIYMNESDVGKAIKKSGVPRDEIFVTTKLWNSDHGNVSKALEKSLKKLSLEYVDLYLMHWPVKTVRNESWKEMEKLLKEGKCRSIGVSNFAIKHIEELLGKCYVKPAVNQVEFSPFLYQKELLGFCEKKGIKLEAYSPLSRGKKLKDARVAEIANAYGKTPAQIMIRWSLQHGLICLPKSKTKERIIENSKVFDFEIKKSDMEKLDSLNENFRTCWDPTEAP